MFSLQKKIKFINNKIDFKLRRYSFHTYSNHLKFLQTFILIAVPFYSKMCC
jgi:hypothetical protein